MNWTRHVAKLREKERARIEAERTAQTSQVSPVSTGTELPPALQAEGGAASGAEGVSSLDSLAAEPCAEPPASSGERRQRPTRSEFLVSTDAMLALLTKLAEEGKETPSFAEMSRTLRIPIHRARNVFKTLYDAGKIVKEHGTGPIFFRIRIRATGKMTALPALRIAAAQAKALDACGYAPDRPVRLPEKHGPFKGKAFKDDPRAILDMGSRFMPPRPDYASWIGSSANWCAEEARR